MTGRLFTSESVTEGHPDKIADQISDTVLDCLIAARRGPAAAAVAVETLLTTGLVVVAGEVRDDRLRRHPASSSARGSSRSATTPRTRASTARPAASRSRSAASPADIAAGRRPRPRVARRLLRGRARPAGRRRPGPDVRLRLRRHPRADAAADHPRAPAGRAADRGPQERHARLPASRRQDPGHHRVRRRPRRSASTPWCSPRSTPPTSTWTTLEADIKQHVIDPVLGHLRHPVRGLPPAGQPDRHASRSAARWATPG